MMMTNLLVLVFVGIAAAAVPPYTIPAKYLNQCVYVDFNSDGTAVTSALSCPTITPEERKDCTIIPKDPTGNYPSCCDTLQSCPPPVPAPPPPAQKQSSSSLLPEDKRIEEY